MTKALNGGSRRLGTPGVLAGFYVMQKTTTAAWASQTLTADRARDLLVGNLGVIGLSADKIDVKETTKAITATMEHIRTSFGANDVGYKQYIKDDVAFGAFAHAMLTQAGEAGKTIVNGLPAEFKTCSAIAALIKGNGADVTARRGTTTVGRTEART